MRPNTTVMTFRRSPAAIRAPQPRLLRQPCTTVGTGPHGDMLRRYQQPMPAPYLGQGHVTAGRGHERHEHASRRIRGNARSVRRLPVSAVPGRVGRRTSDARKGRQSAAQPRCAQTPARRWKATPSAMTRVPAAPQAPGDGHRAAASDAVLRRKLTALGAVARRVAERGEVDLAVSGLKPDWPPRTATAGIAPAGAVRRIVPLQHESG